MKIKFIILSVLIVNQITCQNNENSKINNTIKNQINMKDQEIRNILIKQIESGSDDVYGAYFDYNEEDLKALVTIEDSILKNNGYKLPSKEYFSQKVKLIFNRIIDYRTSTNFIKIETYKDNVCDKKLEFYPYSVDAQYLYIDKNNKFITDFLPLPKILDYLKIYPELAKYEKEDLIVEDKIENIKVRASQWKDIPNLKEIRKKNIQTLVARNMYLFNDNKAQFKWLILNDQYFMESLVKTFGYTEDSDLLKWVIERTKFDKNNPQDYGKLFWIKQCDGSLKINANTFKILQKIYLPDNGTSENRFILDNIKNYLEYLGDEDLSKNENLAREERVKVVANLAYFAEQYKFDKRFGYGYGDDSRIMGRLRYFLGDDGFEILKKNNYFNLPKFKEWWDNADYDEYFVVQCEYQGSCGKGYEPMDYNEWRKQHSKK